MRSTLSLAVLHALTVAAWAAAPPTVTTESLLNELTSLEALAQMPDPPFTCRQASSYDRRSTGPDDHDAWFANADAGNFLRVEQVTEDRKEYVLLDVDGPGAVVRIWSANPKGTLRIYLDGASEPALAVPMTDLLSGEAPGIPVPIAHTASRGWNCYFPFAYAEHCRITSDEGGFYYHVNYRTYPPGTDVRSFAADDLVERNAAVAQTAHALASAPSAPESPPTADRQFVLPPGGTYTVDLSPATAAPSPGLLVERLVLQADADDDAAALRETILSLTFDDERTVEVPLGDFFGTTPGINPYKSRPVEVHPGGRLVSNWAMPARREAKLELRNAGTQPVKCSVQAWSREREWTDRSLHFGAQWRSARDVPSRPFIDWNYCDLRGRGVFVGASFWIANPVRAWWGEGDEKIYVDNEAFPSHFGTGTEDYFGYAWCSNELFTNPFHSQPRCDGPGNYGHTSVNRWHLLDRIPFTERLRFDMEFWHHHAETSADMSAVTYWYARPGLEANRQDITPVALRIPEIPKYTPERVAGALEGEELEILSSTGTTTPQEIAGCSNDEHLWWRDGAVGDRLVFGLPAASAGPHRVIARFIKSWDYAIVQPRVGDQPAGEPLDLYSPHIALTGEIDLGVFPLSDGATFSLEIIGQNEQAKPGNMAGVDYIRLVPANAEGQAAAAE